MKSAVFPIKKLLYTLLLTAICTSAIAQKINTVQQGSVWAPQGVKIDGKLTEWGNTLQAYNKTTKLWYTLANDSNYIYLAIKSTDLNNNTKILAGGISFTLNTEGRKRDKNAFIITFPVVSRAGGRGGRGRRGYGQDAAPDTAAILVQQKQTLATSKEISALGFKDITDTLISIYNEYGIKAAANIDDKGNFVYELAVPLKMFEIPANDQKEMAYDIKVNGLQFNMPANIKISMGGGAPLSISGMGGGRGGGGGGGGPGFGGGSAFGGKSKAASSGADDLTNPNDFWGKYTLATSTGK